MQQLEDRRLMAVLSVDPGDAQPDDLGCGDHFAHPDNPCNTIEAAVHYAEPHDDIIVVPHVYHESVTITKPLSIRSEGGRSTVMGPGPAFTIAPGVSFVGLDSFVGGGGGGVVAGGGGSVVVGGINANETASHGILYSGDGTLMIVGGSFSGNASDGIVVDGGSVTMINTEVAENGGHGMLTMFAGEIDLDGAHFVGNELAGFLAADTLGTVTMKDSAAAENVHEGVLIDGGFAKTTISTSEFDGNGAAGLLISNVEADVQLSGVMARDNEGTNLLIDVDASVRAAKPNVLINGGNFNGAGAGLALPPLAPACGLAFAGVGNVTLNSTAANPLTANNNLLAGLCVNDVDNVTVNGSPAAPATFDTNGLFGIDIVNAADVSMSFVDAKTNGLTGLVADNIEAFVDDHGDYSDNNDGGLVINDAQSLSLGMTTAIQNDADANLVGDGLSATAIAANVTIVDSTFDGGALLGQQRGIHLNDVAGNVEITSKTVRTSASSNQGTGLDVSDVRGLTTVEKVDLNRNGGTGASFSGAADMALGPVTIFGTDATRNGAGGVKVIEIDDDLNVRESHADFNTGHGIEVDGADAAVNVSDSTADTNTLDGIFVDGAITNTGLTTDEKVTIERTSAATNTAAGVRVINSERALVVDSTTNGNNVGVRMHRVSDDITLRRSEASGNATDGVYLTESNDTNFQFLTATKNAANGVHATDGSTLHDSGGNLSENGAAGLAAERMGDLSTFGTELNSNAGNGLRIDMAGFVNLSDSAVRVNSGNSLDIRNAARLTVSNIDHRDNVQSATVENTSPVRFIASTGEVEDLVTLTGETTDVQNTLTLEHVRTLIGGDQPLEVPQDTIVFFGVDNVEVHTGEAADTIVVNPLPGVDALTLYGQGGDDLFDIKLSTNTDIIVNGTGNDDPADHDLLKVDSFGEVVADDGQAITSSSYRPLVHQEIEEVDALFATEPLLGDANGDGLFDSSDLVAVFSAAKYEKDEPATFAEGDWNGDGRFDTADLIEALKTGRYQR